MSSKSDTVRIASSKIPIAVYSEACAGSTASLRLPSSSVLQPAYIIKPNPCASNGRLTVDPRDGRCCPCGRAASSPAYQAQREQQDQVATQPATTPRNLDPPVEERPVAGVQQPPLSRAQRPDYERRVEERWSQPPTYHLTYDTTRTGIDYHQEMDQARHAQLEAAARLEDQWDRQRRDAAERE